VAQTSTDRRGRPFGPLREKFTAEVRPRTEAQRRGEYVLAAALAVIGLAGFLILLVSVLRHDGAALLDKPIQHSIESLRPGPTPFFAALAVVFGPIGMPIIVAITVVIWFIRADHAWRPLLLGAATLTGVVLAEVIAHLVQRPRPPLAQMLLDQDHTFSFPSGHLLGIANYCFVGGYLIASRRQHIGASVTAILVGVGLTALMALDRVYLGYHWPTDTLASACIALLELGVVIAVDTWRTVETKQHGAPARVKGGETREAPA
jgi:undecaprenyl-diphosphatase